MLAHVAHVLCCLRVICVSFCVLQIHVMYLKGICMYVFLFDRLAPPYLCDQYVCHSVDSVVPVGGRNKVLSPAFSETREEMCVKLQEVFQAGEQTVQPT